MILSAHESHASPTPPPPLFFKIPPLLHVLYISIYYIVIFLHVTSFRYRSDTYTIYQYVYLNKNCSNKIFCINVLHSRDDYFICRGECISFGCNHYWNIDHNWIITVRLWNLNVEKRTWGEYVFDVIWFKQFLILINLLESLNICSYY